MQTMTGDKNPEASIRWFVTPGQTILETPYDPAWLSLGLDGKYLPRCMLMHETSNFSLSLTFVLMDRSMLRSFEKSTRRIAPWEHKVPWKKRQSSVFLWPNSWDETP